MTLNIFGNGPDLYLCRKRPTLARTISILKTTVEMARTLSMHPQLLGQGQEPGQAFHDLGLVFKAIVSQRRGKITLLGFFNNGSVTSLTTFQLCEDDISQGSTLTGIRR